MVRDPLRVGTKYGKIKGQFKSIQEENETVLERINASKKGVEEYGNNQVVKSRN